MGRTNYSAGFETSPTGGIDLKALAALLTANGGINTVINAGQTADIATNKVKNAAQAVEIDNLLQTQSQQSHRASSHPEQAATQSKQQPRASSHPEPATAQSQQPPRASSR